ncbi:methylated-DNA--[protein]-cysteine S-methyltransferase [candidate division GN15 bacterium]|nr:methylated-DNA--[protein]-cysteine S-methyltransferase [candidate division GN15 bacterium]
MLYVHAFNTPWGRICSAATDSGLSILTLPGTRRSVFERQVERCFSGWHIESGGTENERLEKQVLAYFAGTLREFSLKLDTIGTSFQRCVLSAVAQIPYGKTRTYGEIAQQIGNPNAARAVGAANGSNRLPLVIPCHRVVAGNGIGGYAGGRTVKERLLRLEGALML